jgi:hypothetical protein
MIGVIAIRAIVCIGIRIATRAFAMFSIAIYRRYLFWLWGIIARIRNACYGQ